MSHHGNDRVLNRRGCHELTQQEVEGVTGNGGFLTVISNIMTAVTIKNPNPDHIFDE